MMHYSPWGTKMTTSCGLSFKTMKQGDTFDMAPEGVINHTTPCKECLKKARKDASKNAK